MTSLSINDLIMRRRACRAFSDQPVDLDIVRSLLETGKWAPSGVNLSETAANGVLVLLVVTCSLLDKQIAAQAKAFQEEGGFTERLYRIRIEERRKQQWTKAK